MLNTGSLISLPQQHIKVAVNFYNEDHRDKLLKYALGKEIEKIVRDGVDIPVEEFLTYYLFHRKRPGMPGWKNYREVGAHLDTALHHLGGLIEFNGMSINTAQNVGSQVGYVTEYIGESIGLAVINRVHALTAADWNSIQVTSGKGKKALDYRVASDSQDIIEVENKGSSVDDNTRKCPTVSKHMGSIRDKKKDIDIAVANNEYPFPTSVRYGTICVMGTDSKVPVRCLLLDPPSDGDGSAARRLKLLNRMSFIRDWIAFISPRSPFSAALQSRAAALNTLSNPFELDNVELLKGNGEPFNFIQVNGNSTFFNVKSKVLGGGVGGVVVPLPNGSLFFLGVRDALVERASRQQLQELLSYRALSENGIRTIECVLSARTFEEFRLSAEIKESAYQNAGYYYFQLKGHLFYSDSGIVFGPLFMKSGD